MDPKTYDIAKFESREEAKRAGYTIGLSHQEAQKLSGVPRSERRAELSKLRRDKRRRQRAARKKTRQAGR